MRIAVLYLPVFLLSVYFGYIFKRYALKKGLIDNPNHRSSHTIPTPRGAGIVFIGLWYIFVLISGIMEKISWQIILILAPTLLVSIISYLDDYYTLSAKIRFSIQSLASIIVLIFLGNIILELGFFSIHFFLITFIFLFLALIWSTNLFNFMDGMDGLAATEAIFILGVGGLLTYLNGGIELSHLLWGLVALLMGFLVWNRPKAKIFMGDVGSASLGFVILVSGLIAQKYYQVPFVLWLMLYGAFLFDSTATLIRRLLKGEKWYEAHRKHAYQRLHQAGWSHAKILYALIAVNFIIAGLAIEAYFLPAITFIFVLLEILLLFIIYKKIEKLRAMK